MPQLARLLHNDFRVKRVLLDPDLLKGKMRRRAMYDTARNRNTEAVELTANQVAALLHDRAIEELTVAIGAIEAEDIEARCTCPWTSQMAAKLPRGWDPCTGS